MTEQTKQRYRLKEGKHYEPTESYLAERGGKDDHRIKPSDTNHLRLTPGSILESARPLDEIFPNKWEKVVEGQVVVVSEVRRAKVTELISLGVWTDADRDFLEQLPEDGFARILRHSVAKIEGAGVPRATSTLGEDVTDQFIRAYDEDFRVWRNSAGKHQVTRRGQPTKPLNPKALDALEVDKWVDEYLKEKGGKKS